jgi:hypothetical protein
MATPAQIRRQLFGAPTPRPPKAYDHLTKATLWTEVERLRVQLREAHRVATVAANAIDTLGTEGTLAYRQLTGARQTLREVRALTEDKSQI